MSPPILDPIRGALLRSQPDPKLVALVRDGRERAFEEIVRRYRAPLVGFAAMIVPPHRADDVVQESLLAAYDSLGSSDAEIVLRPWLFKIVRNRALNSLRDNPDAEELTEEPDGVAGPAEIAEQREEVAALVGGLQALPDAQREAIVARELEGRGHAEIAAELGTSPGAVRQLIFRARGTLRGAAGVLIPLPLLRFLLGPGGTEAGVSAAAGAGIGAAAATGGGTAAGLGVGTKVAVGIAGVALAVGGGIAVERNKGADRPSDGPDRDGQALAAQGVSSGEAGSSASSGGDSSSAGGSEGSGGPGPSARSGPGDDPGDDGRERDDDSSGHEDGDDEDGDGDSSGPGAGDDEFDDDDSGSGSTSSGSGSSGSGSGSSGSGSSGSGSSGSGSGSSGSDSFDDADFDEPEIEVDDDSSGSGSSGSDLETSDSDSDSSGSGSGDD